MGKNLIASEEVYLSNKKAWKRIEVSSKTVDMFSSLIRTPLSLRDSRSKAAYTDGITIWAPFQGKDLYELVEHEIAHILFKSDSVARDRFIHIYQERISRAAKSLGLDVDIGAIGEMLQSVIGILEDRRVNSLWGRVYEGSAKLIDRSYRELVETNVQPVYLENDAHSLYDHMLLRIYAPHVLPDREGRWSPLDETLEDAVKMVEGRGFPSTLAASKFFVNTAVNLMLQGASGSPSRDGHGSDVDDRQRPLFGKASSKGSRGSSEESGSERSGSEGGEESSDDSDETSASGGSSGCGSPSPKSGSSKAPAPTKEEILRRLKALEDIARRMKDPSRSKNSMGSELRNRLEDYRPSSFEKRAMPRRKDDIVLKKIIDTPTEKLGSLEKAFEKHDAEMTEAVDKAKEAVQELLEDDAITKRSGGVVAFEDVSKSSLRNKAEVLPEDRRTVERLRGIFNRVLGKRNSRLEDSGVEIDVEAFLQRKVSGEDLPVFKAPVLGRGFKALVLLDFSSSMSGCKLATVDRVARIVTQAMKYPFVDLKVWGFTSRDNGVANLMRFPENAGSFLPGGSTCTTGVTPLHIAIRVARKALLKGSDRKHLFVITDGYPVFRSLEGGCGTMNLIEEVKLEIERTRRDGISVTSVMIQGGSLFGGMSDDQLGFMFGPRRTWKSVDSSSLKTDLVSLISGSFMDYLKHS